MPLVDKKPKDYKQKSKQQRKPCQTNSDNFFYSMPNSKLLTVLIIFAIIVVIVMLYIFKYVTRNCGFNDSTNGAVGIYLSMVGLPVGVVLSFIVANTWSSFADASNKENEEATKLLLLYDLLTDIPGGAAIQDTIKIYTSFIITDEFPLMADGIQSTEGLAIILGIGDMIYNLNPQPGKETVLYNQSIDMYQQITSLRIIRMGYVVYGLAPELWWVLILGVVMVIVMSFFIYIKSWNLHVVLVSMTAATLISLLFLIVALNYPYRGDFGLDSLPYQIALANMVQPPTTDLIPLKKPLKPCPSKSSVGTQSSCSCSSCSSSSCSSPSTQSSCSSVDAQSDYTAAEYSDTVAEKKKLARLLAKHKMELNK